MKERGIDSGMLRESGMLTMLQNYSCSLKDDIQSNLRMREKHCFQNKPYHYNYMKYDILHE